MPPGKSKPDKRPAINGVPLYSIEDYAKHRDVTRTAIYNAMDRGIISPSSFYEIAGRKWIDQVAADRDFAKNAPHAKPLPAVPVVPKMAPAEASPASPVITQQVNKADAQARTENLRAELLEIKLAKERGRLVAVADVAAVVAGEYANTRQRLLALPTRLAPTVALLTDAMEVRKAIEAAIVEALEELAADAAVFTPDEDDDEDAEGSDDDLG